MALLNTLCTIFMLYVASFSVVQSELCEKLFPNKNVELRCTRTLVTSDPLQSPDYSKNCSDYEPSGTRAKYQCGHYYIPLATFKYQQEEDQNELICERNGTWSSLERFNEFVCVEDCGRRKVNKKPLIINGETTNQAQSPWHVNLYRKVYGLSFNYSYICGGSLVRASTVLTAAHCVTNGRGSALDSSELIILIGLQRGELYLNIIPDDVQAAKVKEIFLHDGYDPRQEFQADIALVQLENKVKLSDNVLPVCLPTDHVIELESTDSGMFGEVVGFGIDETGNYSSTLKSGKLKVKSRAECFHSLQVRLPESKICAGTLQDSGEWTSVCNGDSGGGFIFPSPLMEKYYVNGVVSYSNSNPSKGSGFECQKNAVFTRVYSYINWIRNVLNGIHGSVIPELEGNELIPFIQKRNEKLGTGRSEFPVINRALENKITSIELVHSRVNSGKFLETLGHTKRLQAINLTDISLDSKFQTRILLPYLKTFVLDIAVPEYEQLVLKNLFNPTIHSTHLNLTAGNRTELLKSLLFFEKEYDKELNVMHIAPLGINTQITLKTIKLINVNHDEGKIVLTSIPQTNEVLNSIPLEDEFTLRHLAIAGCIKLNLTEIIKRGRLISLNSVVFRFVDDLIGKHGLPDLVKKANFLKSLVIHMSHNDKHENSSRKRIIYITQLPRTLRTLSLVRVQLKYTEPSWEESRIVFPEVETTHGKWVSPKNVQAFSCFDCKFSKTVLQEFSWIFMNLRKIRLFVNNTFNFTRLVNELHQLEFAYLGTVKEDTNLYTTYEGLSELVGYKEDSGIKRGGFSRQSNGSWLFIPNSATLHYYNALQYKDDLLSEFYTGFADYVIGARRHEAHEITAVETEIYTFYGTKLTGTVARENLPDISLLTHYIRVINISFVQINPILFTVYMGALRESLKLKEMNLRSVLLLGGFEEKMELSPELSKFHLQIDKYEGIESGHRNMFERSQFELFIPFDISKYLFPFNNTNLQLQDFELIIPYIVLYSYNNHNRMMIISYLNFADEILLGSGILTTQVRIEMLNICYSEFDASNIPLELTSLQIHGFAFTRSDQDDSLDVMIRRLNKLTKLALIAPYYPDPTSGIVDRSTNSEVNVMDIHSSELEHLGIGHLNLTIFQNYIMLPQFTSLQILAAFSIFVDPTIRNKFWAIFPVTKFAILTNQYGDAEQHKVLLASALKNPRLKWILFNTEPDWSEVGGHEIVVEGSEHLKEIKSILGFQIYDLWSKKHYADFWETYRDIFEIERSDNGTWVIVADNQKYLQDKLAVLGPVGLFRGCDINNIIDYKF